MLREKCYQMGRWYSESVSGLRLSGLLFSHHAAKRNRFKKKKKESRGRFSAPSGHCYTHCQYNTAVQVSRDAEAFYVG